MQADGAVFLEKFLVSHSTPTVASALRFIFLGLDDLAQTFG